MTKKRVKAFESQIEEAKEKVVKAARKYVNFEDQGSVDNLLKATKLQMRLVDAVNQLELIEKTYKTAKDVKPSFPQRLIVGYN